MALRRLCGEVLDEARLLPETEGATDHVFRHALGRKPATAQQFGSFGRRERTAERVGHYLSGFRQQLDQELC